jgi:hypothetical protein
LRNLITDVAGVRVGHADDRKLASGVTVVVFDEAAVAAVDLRGGAPGTRDSASTRLRCRAAPRSGSTLRAARRRGCASRATAFASARR